MFFLLDAAKKFNAAEAPVPSEMGAQGTTGAAPGGQPAIPEGNFDPKKYNFLLKSCIFWKFKMMRNYSLILHERIVI